MPKMATVAPASTAPATATNDSPKMATATATSEAATNDLPSTAPATATNVSTIALDLPALLALDFEDCDDFDEEYWDVFPEDDGEDDTQDDDEVLKRFVMKPQACPIVKRILKPFSEETAEILLPFVEVQSSREYTNNPSRPELSNAMLDSTSFLMRTAKSSRSGIPRIYTNE